MYGKEVPYNINDCQSITHERTIAINMYTRESRNAAKWICLLEFLEITTNALVIFLPLQNHEFIHPAQWSRSESIASVAISVIGILTTIMISNFCHQNFMMMKSRDFERMTYVISLAHIASCIGILSWTTAGIVLAMIFIVLEMVLWTFQIGIAYDECKSANFINNGTAGAFGTQDSFHNANYNWLSES